MKYDNALYGCCEFDDGWNNFQVDFYWRKIWDIWLLDYYNEVIWKTSRLSVMLAINEFGSLDVDTTMMKDKSLFFTRKWKKVIKDSLCNQLQWPSTFSPCVQYSEYLKVNHWRVCEYLVSKDPSEECYL